MEQKACLLCGDVTELIKQSHIIPKFMYKGMTDQKNRMQLTSRVNDRIGTRIINNPFYDKYILCRKCENERLASVEKYADRVFYTVTPPADNFAVNFKINPESIRYIHLENIDYRKFKLFLLSVLWRAHVSTHAFFKQINLGPLATEIKQKILSEDPGPDTDIKIYVCGLQINRSTFYKVVGNPRAVVTAELEWYSFLINGFVYNFVVRDIKNELQIGECYLKSNNEMIVPLFDGVGALAFLSTFCGQSTPFG